MRQVSLGKEDDGTRGAEGLENRDRKCNDQRLESGKCNLERKAREDYTSLTKKRGRRAAVVVVASLQPRGTQVGVRAALCIFAKFGSDESKMWLQLPQRGARE